VSRSSLNARTETRDQNAELRPIAFPLLRWSTLIVADLKHSVRKSIAHNLDRTVLAVSC
jgi:hypothetical protein